MTKDSQKIMPPWRVMLILIGIPFVITTAIFGYSYFSNELEIKNFQEQVNKEANKEINKKKQKTEQLRLQQQWLKEKPNSV